MEVDLAPEVAVKKDLETGVHLDPAVKEQYNPTYETIFKPEFIQKLPVEYSKLLLLEICFLSMQSQHISLFKPGRQRRKFATYSYAQNPSLNNHQVTTKYISSVEVAEKNQGLTLFESGQSKWYLILMVSSDGEKNMWVKKMDPNIQRRNKRSLMKLQQRSSKKANGRGETWREDNLTR